MSGTRLRPTRTALGLVGGAAVLFAVGTNVQAGWLVVLTALMLGAVATGAVLPALAIRRVSVERIAPASAWAREPLRVRLAVRNEARSARGLLLLRDTYLGEGTVVVPRLGPGERREYEGARSGARRGVHEGGSCEIATGAPFGVVLATREVEVRSRTVVYPRLFDVGDATRWAGMRDGIARPRPSVTGDTSSVRPYRPGDPLRHVHWRSSARAGELVVREFEDDTGGEVVVVADTPADEDALDTVASACCSWAVALLGEGRRVRLMWWDGTRPAHLEVGTPTEALEWGARLSASGTRVADVIGAVPAGQAIVCALAAGPHAAAAAARLAERARAGAEVFVIAVGGLEDVASVLSPAAVSRA